MPIDFCAGKQYDFDFNKLVRNLINYYNSNEFIAYLNEWEKLLKDFDKKAIIEYDNFSNKTNRCMYRPEFYQFHQSFFENEKPYIFHFNIENILLNTNNKYRSKTTLVKRLAESVSYNKSIILDDRKVKKEPIIICELYMPKYRYVVIDGNTRLNYLLKNNKWFIRYIIYEPNKRNDFLLSVDWAMYHFTIEVNKILQDYLDNEKMLLNIKNSKIYNSQFIDEINHKYPIS